MLLDLFCGDLSNILAAATALPKCLEAVLVLQGLKMNGGQLLLSVSRFMLEFVVQNSLDSLIPSSLLTRTF
jgi:hypothetical protein